MSFDWNAIEADFRAQTRELAGLSLERERIEEFAQEIAAGRLSAASNRVSGLRFATGNELFSLDSLSRDERERLRELGGRAISAGRVAVAVLNGGMATRFGGEVKGIVEAIGGRSFLEIKLAQVLSQTDLPLLIMNSFATHRRTLEFLSKRGLVASTRPFLQDVSLRLTPKGELFRDNVGRVSLYAPGHGDFPDALRRAGLIDELRRNGVELLTLSNIDNLGAELDPLLIGFHLDAGRPLTAEVAPTEPGDVGGAPAFVSGKLQIVEGFRYPERMETRTSQFLATNSFIFSLALLAAPHALSWFYVEKQVEGRSAVQMERLVNELSAHVDTAFLAVSRGPAGRFLPIKTREDLEALRASELLVRRFAAPQPRRL